MKLLLLLAVAPAFAVPEALASGETDRVLLLASLALLGAASFLGILSREEETRGRRSSDRRPKTEHSDRPGLSRHFPGTAALVIVAILAGAPIVGLAAWVALRAVSYQVIRLDPASGSVFSCRSVGDPAGWHFEFSCGPFYDPEPIPLELRAREGAR